MPWQDQLKKRVFVPSYLWQMIFVHALTLAAIPYFTLPAFLFAFVATMVFGYALGIFHHMLFSHWSFNAHPWLMKLGGLLGTLSWRGPFAAPVRYAAMHRIHHTYSDTDSDPHSPVHGHFHGFMGWFWNHSPLFLKYEDYSPFAKRLAELRWAEWMDKNVNFLQFLWGMACFLGGFLFVYLTEGNTSAAMENGVRYTLYGVFVKTFILVYAANTVDVINHTVGYRNVETRDQSTNSFLMFAFHLGGAISWHNNHHAKASYFSVRYCWWEIDMHLQLLRLLSLLGLVSDIKVLEVVDGEKRPMVLAKRSAI